MTIEAYSAEEYYFNGNIVTADEQYWERAGTVNTDVPEDTSELMLQPDPPYSGCPIQVAADLVWYHVMFPGPSWAENIVGSAGVHPDFEWRARSEDGEWITEWVSVKTSVGTFPDTRSRTNRPFEFWREVAGSGIDDNYRIEFRSVSGGFSAESEYTGIQNL